MPQMDKKGQMSLGDAPNVVLIVGLTFLVMATMAFIGYKYGDAIPSDYSKTVVNESVTTTQAGTAVAGSSACNFEDFSVLTVINKTGTVLTSTNWTATTAGLISNRSSVNGNVWNVTYSYSYAGVACNVTTDLNTEISNNTSIAGIVLTISLVGIVLTVLIGIFMVARNRGM